jgi:hypothetical protein
MESRYLMASQFERDKHLVELFMQRQGWSPFEYHDPNTQARQTGADVLIVSGGRRIGIQVTEIDTGERRGRARAKERKEWRDSNLSTYCTSAQSDTNKLLAAITRDILGQVRKAENYTFNEFDAVWLLASAGIREMGSLASTLVISLGLHASALDVATLDHLSRSKYERAYLHCMLGVERALYSWQKGGRWEKQIQQEPPQGPSFWDFQKLMR